MRDKTTTPATRPGTPHVVNEAAVRLHARCLWCCLGLFIGRVIAQPLSLVIDGVPRFETWQSGVMPYWILLTTQLLIVAVLLYLAWSVSAATVTPRRRVGILVLSAGATYFTAM